jgi:hypothetical protein
MKHVFTTPEVPHIWAAQAQENGRNSRDNLYFNGLTIYSYGSHFPIATIWDKDTNVVFFTSKDYSNTTSSHKSMVRGAIRHKKIFTVPSVLLNSKYKCDTDQVHSINIAYYLNIIETLTNKQKRARKYSYLPEINSTLEQFQEYVALFKLTSKLKKAERELLAYTSADTLTGGCDFTDLRIKQRKAQTDKQTRDAKKRLFEWLGCKVTYKKDKVYLRAYGEDIQTTMGANVPVREAKILFDRIRTGKDVKGFKIGYYTVISLNGTLKIGCHNIERDEIDRLAKSLNWI